MKTHIFFKFICIAVYLLFTNNTFAKTDNIKYVEKNGEIYVQETTVAEIEKLFSFVKYKNYLAPKDGEYPSIFLQKLPSDFADLEDESYRNRLFIQILAPIALKVNQDIYAQRQKLLDMQTNYNKTYELSEKDTAELEGLAEKYDVFTRLQGNRRIQYLFNELKLKVDIIAPSLLIGAAAIESNWGTARPALLANSLYKEKVWYGEEKGLPSLEDIDDDYEFKIFNTIYDSMMSYSIKINSGVDFYYMRSYRSEYRRRKRDISGRTLAHSMMLSSKLKNFAGLLDYTITFYEMMNFDNAKLSRIYTKYGE